MTPFRLPDLVLGVSIVADTSGARQAGRDLKNAVNQGFNGPGGGGGGGGGAGGGGLGTFGGSLLGSLIGTGGLRDWKTAEGRIAKLKGFMAKPVKSTLLLPSPSALVRRGRGGHPGEREAQYATIDAPNLFYKKAIPSAASVAGAAKSAAKTMAGQAKAMASGLKGVWGRFAKTALSSGMFAALSKGNIMGMLLKFGKVFWPLLIVALVAALFAKVVYPAVKAAFGYIRNVGARGKYGEFGQEAASTPTLLKNAQVQFGLMAITLLNLNSVLVNVNLGLMRLGTVFSFIADHPLGFKMAMMASGIGAFIVAVPYILDLLEFVTRWIPTTGGKDLGAGRSGKLGGAMLEGSVEAYSTIQGTMQRYAAQTAKNTKESSDALKRILARGGDMGVVPG